MLTFQERQTLRELVSDAMRTKYLAFTSNFGRCKECGVPWERYCVGCKTCDQRKFERRRREQPYRLEYERKRNLLRKQARQ